MIKRALVIVAVLIAAGGLVLAQASGQGQKPQAGQKPVMSPPAETSVTIAGKTITIKYSAPSVRGRQMFGDGGVISKDRTYPVWRAGANSATSLHTDGTLTIENLVVPPGDY